VPQKQPACLHDDSLRLYDCGTWQVSASWAVPRDAMSGIYIARLVREDADPLSWRPDNGRAGRGEVPEPGPHAYGALGLGRLANALKEPRQPHLHSSFATMRVDPICSFRRRTRRGRRTTARALRARTASTASSTAISRCSR
jgi:hypothetical protein